MTDAHHEATLAAMREAGCRRVYPVYPQKEPVGYCHNHGGAWTGDVCPVIDAAARIGYDAGRRDALNEAAEAAEVKANGWRRWQEVRPDAPGRPTAFGAEKALDGIADHLRSLLTTTKETDR